MRKRSRKSSDLNKRAFEVVEEATSEDAQSDSEDDGKNPHAVALGRLGGKKGGKARAANMTAEERSESARNAAKARWKK